MAGHPAETTLDSVRDIRVLQPRKGYRFSVDALLLYSFVNVRTPERIADLGSGCGIIGLLLAKKYPFAGVALFEIQDSLASVAEENIAINSLSGRVEAVRADLREAGKISPHCFDVAVSNPPFRKNASGRISPEEEKAVARHEIMLDLRSLAAASQRLLKPTGRLFLIYHPARLSELIGVLREKKIEAKRLRFVHADSSAEAKMVMVESVRNGRPGIKVEQPFFIYAKKGQYSSEMQKIYVR